MADDVLHDFRPGVWPGHALLRPHLEGDHNVDWSKALMGAPELIHQAIHAEKVASRSPETE